MQFSFQSDTFKFPINNQNILLINKIFVKEFFYDFCRSVDKRTGWLYYIISLVNVLRKYNFCRILFLFESTRTSWVCHQGILEVYV